MPKQDTQTKLEPTGSALQMKETTVKHIKKIEAQPAQTNATGAIKAAAPALGGGCIPVGV